MMAHTIPMTTPGMTQAERIIGAHEDHAWQAPRPGTVDGDRDQEPEEQLQHDARQDKDRRYP